MNDQGKKKEIEFNLLMKRRPNIYGNRFGVRLLKRLLWLAALFFLISGIILTISAISENTKDAVFGMETVVDKNHKGMLAACCFLIWASLSVAVWFGKMLQKRNEFLIELDIWHQQQQAKKNNEGS
ncbi:MAG: hypothetical protein Crog4KO_21320 [Crocinitomicaceae bacterium]